MFRTGHSGCIYKDNAATDECTEPALLPEKSKTEIIICNGWKKVKNSSCHPQLANPEKRKSETSQKGQAAEPQDRKEKQKDRLQNRKAEKKNKRTGF